MSLVWQNTLSALGQPKPYMPNHYPEESYNGSWDKPLALNYERVYNPNLQPYKGIVQEPVAKPFIPNPDYAPKPFIPQNAIESNTGNMLNSNQGNIINDYNNQNMLNTNNNYIPSQNDALNGLNANIGLNNNIGQNSNPLGQFNAMTGGQFSGYGNDTLNGWLGQMHQQGIDVNKMSNSAMQDSIAAYNNNQLATAKFQPTALDWGQFALKGIGQAFSMYSNYKQLKLAKDNFKEMKALNRANYRNQAKSMNANYRNQMSGRGYIGMSSKAKQALGTEYNNRKVKETY